MSQPSLLPDDWISAEPENESILMTRPNSIGSWKAPASSNPAAFIKLVDNDEEPLPVGKVVIIGNMQEATIYIQTKDEDDLPFEPVVKSASGIAKVGNITA